MTPLVVVALCLAASGLAQAEPADDRARLAAERQAIKRRFDQEEHACRLKFAISGCLTDVRARRREALAPLRERELSLADQERQQRALERARTLAAKQQAAADRPAEMPEPVLKLRQPPPPARSASAVTTPRVDDQASREAEASLRAQASARRQADIEAGKKRVADRIATRASEGKAVQPLPPLPTVPTSALPASRASPPQP